MEQAGIWAVRVGERVVVRHRLTLGGLSDAVGELTAVDTALHLLTRTGPVAIGLDRVVTGKVLPPRPSRRGPAHRVTCITDLQAVMSRHWRPPQLESLGGWVLRAAGGFTRRANSALPLADPLVPLPQALAATSDWYRRRDLPATVCLPGPAPDGVPDDASAASAARSACADAGWRLVADGSALVLTAATAALRHRQSPTDLPARGLHLRASDHPDEAWLAGYRYRGQVPPAAAIDLLLSAPQQRFVTIREQDRTVAVARGSLAGGWAGLTAVEVAPQARGRGLGTALLTAVADWAWRGGAASTFLQVAESNRVAQQVYARAGFEVHHRYDYVQAP